MQFENERKTVLIAEDDAIVALDLEENFRRIGYNVIGPFAEGSEAIRYMLANPPTCAVIDYRLKDGFADRLLKLLSARDIPSVVITSSSPRQRHMKLAHRNVFPKPFDIQRVTEVLSAE